MALQNILVRKLEPFAPDVFRRKVFVDRSLHLPVVISLPRSHGDHRERHTGLDSAQAHGDILRIADLVIAMLRDVHQIYKFRHPWIKLFFKSMGLGFSEFSTNRFKAVMLSSGLKLAGALGTRFPTTVPVDLVWSSHTRLILSFGYNQS